MFLEVTHLLIRPPAYLLKICKLCSTPSKINLLFHIIDIFKSVDRKNSITCSYTFIL